MAHELKSRKGDCVAMASPQLEDGFIRIANELMEAILGFGFTHREVMVLFSIIRKTYGFGKKTDDISASQLGEICKIPRQHITTTLNALAQRNVITKESGRFGSIIGIQKNHKKWVGATTTKTPMDSPELGQDDSPKSGQGCPESGHVPNQDRGCPESGQFDSPKSGHTKDNLTKDNLQKKGAREDRTFKQWMESCRAEDRKAIPEDDPVFNYADEVGIHIELIRMAWVEFKRKYANTNKRYKNWNQHFQNAVRENWYGIWYEKGGEWLLTTRGKQIEIEMKAKRDESE